MRYTLHTNWDHYYLQQYSKGYRYLRYHAGVKRVPNRAGGQHRVGRGRDRLLTEAAARLSAECTE